MYSFTDDQLDDYIQFIYDSYDYALFKGYNLKTDSGLREAIADEFLLSEFLTELSIA